MPKSPEAGAVARVQNEGAPASGDFGIAAADGDGGQVAVAIHREAVFASAQQGDGGIGSIHLKGLALAESAQADMQGAAGERELHHAVVEIEDGERGFRPHAQGGGAHVEFGAGIAVGPQVVPVVERVVDGGGGPFIDRSRAEGDGSAHVVQTGHAGRRVLCLVLPLILTEGGDGRDRQKSCQQVRFAHHILLLYISAWRIKNVYYTHL